MPAVAALLRSSTGLAALRRTLAGSPVRLHSCRSPAALLRAYHDRLLDSVVLGLRALKDVPLETLRAKYPGIPVTVYGTFRPGDGELMVGLTEQIGVSALLVEGVDDPVFGDLVLSHGAGRARERALGDALRLLRLREEIQAATWSLLVRRAGHPITASEVADRLGVTREHLSRQFGAGGAPNLKRVIDLLRIVCAAQLLGNPGYDPHDASRLLGFSSPSHLGQVTRRVTGQPVARLADLGPTGVLMRFVRVGMRSRG